MKKLIKLEQLVQDVLLENKETRGNDYELILRVYEKCVPNIGLYSFQKLLLNHKELALPPFESITRCRRKLQSQYADLLPEQETLDMRCREQTEYVEYSKVKVK